MGKSHILQALGQKACVHGYRVLYRTSAKLISDLTASLADKTLPEKLRRYARPDFLIIDAFGCDLIERQESPQSAHLLYKIIDLRNQRKSTALATNVDFEKWGNYLSDGPLAMAFLDRIVEKAIILKVQGKSYRAHGPEKENKRRKRSRSFSSCQAAPRSTPRHIPQSATTTPVHTPLPKWATLSPPPTAFCKGCGL